MNISIGIDPGLKTGGLTILPDNYMDMRSYMTPRFPSQTVRGKVVVGEINLYETVKIIVESICSMSLSCNSEDDINIVIVYEDVHSLAKSSSLGNFNFGQRKGEIAGIAETIKYFMDMNKIIDRKVNFMVRKVYSTIWQKHCITFKDKVFTEKGSVDTKETSKRCAMRRFPWYRFTKGKGVVVQDGMTDSALIALYGMEVILEKQN